MRSWTVRKRESHSVECVFHIMEVFRIVERIKDVTAGASTGFEYLAYCANTGALWRHNMVNVPKGYRSTNVQNRRTGGGSSRGGTDLLGGMLGGNATGGGLLGSLGKAALPMILGSLMRGRGRSGGGLGGLLGGLLGGGNDNTQADAMSDEERDNVDDEATLLLRAMINAAKADGKIEQEEIENITGRLGEIDAEEKAFLEAEFQAPLDVAAFCATVPEELDEEVYAFSVMGMRLDTKQEAQYLGAVAQCLHLKPETCNAIHEKLGAPKIFDA